MEKGPFFVSGVCLDSEKNRFTPTKLPVISPAAFSPCLLIWERRLLLLERCLPLLLSFPVYSLCTEWTGGAETETWTEEQKLNVASERINNHD